MKRYRIKHVPTGLYYKPGEVNLSKNGKVYTTGVNAFSYFSCGYIPVGARKGSKLHISTQNIIRWLPTAYYSWKVSSQIPIDQFIKEPI